MPFSPFLSACLRPPHSDSHPFLIYFPKLVEMPSYFFFGFFCMVFFFFSHCQLICSGLPFNLLGGKISSGRLRSFPSPDFYVRFSPFFLLGPLPYLTNPKKNFPFQCFNLPQMNKTLFFPPTTLLFIPVGALILFLPRGCLDFMFNDTFPAHFPPDPAALHFLRIAPSSVSRD